MEQLLTLWVDDINKKIIPLTQCATAANSTKRRWKWDIHC